MDMQLWITNQQRHRNTPSITKFQSPYSVTAVMESLEDMLEKFAPISLKEMDEVALLNRVDRKFILSRDQLFNLVKNLQSSYRILTIHSQKLNHYHTVYFDTPDFALFLMHVNDQAERYKIRYREYLDTCESYIEVKHKTRKERTVKIRIPALLPYTNTIPEVNAWLSEASPYDPSVLEPKLSNSFTRVTLVSKTGLERVTLDSNLLFFTSTRIARLPNLAVAEVKTDSSHSSSPILEELRRMRIQTQGFSKYCVGVALLYDGVKKNAMKPKLKMLEKIIPGDLKND
mgnify:FL=1